MFNGNQYLRNGICAMPKWCTSILDDEKNNVNKRCKRSGSSTFCSVCSFASGMYCVLKYLWRFNTITGRVCYCWECAQTQNHWKIHSMFSLSESFTHASPCNHVVYIVIKTSGYIGVGVVRWTYSYALALLSGTLTSIVFLLLKNSTVLMPHHSRDLDCVWRHCGVVSLSVCVRTLGLYMLHVLMHW